MRTIMILTLLPLVLVIFLACALVTNPEVEYAIGQTLIRKNSVGMPGDWATYWLTQAADHGQADAQALLGRCYLVGLPVQKLDLASKYLMMGEKQNNLECLKLLSYAYAYGQGVPQDYDKSIKLSKRSLEIETDGRELMNLSFLTLILAAPHKNYVESRKRAEELSRVGFSSAWAYWNLGTIYEYGLGTAKDWLLARKYYRIGATLGDNDCQYALVRMTMEGKLPAHSSQRKELAEQLPIDDPKALRLELENAAATQVMDAQLLLALILASETRDKRSDTKYRDILEQLAKRGFIDFAARLKTVSPPGQPSNSQQAIKLLTDETNDSDGTKLLVAAMCKRFGIGGAPDYNAFFQTLNQACAKNLVDAITIKANILTGMDSGDPDYDSAAKLYRIASEKNQTYAQSQFGMLNALGFGVKHDWKTAISWLEKSANAGDPESQYMLGGFYCDGRGVAPDRKKALELFERSAKQNHEDAALELGIVSGSGEFPDTPQDAEKSEYWLRRAAGFGFQEANYFLGTELANRLNKPKEAITCFKTAAAKGHLLSTLELGKIYLNDENLKDAKLTFEAASKQGNPEAKRELKLLAVKSVMFGSNRQAKSLAVAKVKIAKGTVITPAMVKMSEYTIKDADADWENDLLISTKPIIGATAQVDLAEGEYIGLTDIDFPDTSKTVKKKPPALSFLIE